MPRTLASRLLLLAALALAACDSDGADLLGLNVSELGHDPAMLAGTWELVSSTSAGYGALPTTTPVAPGTESLTFRADGTLEVYQNGRLSESTVWAIEELADVGPAPLLRIGTEADYRRLFFGVTPTRLYFDGRPSDGNLAEYARR